MWTLLYIYINSITWIDQTHYIWHMKIKIWDFLTCSFWNEICYKIHNGPKNEEL